MKTAGKARLALGETTEIKGGQSCAGLGALLAGFGFAGGFLGLVRAEIATPDDFAGLCEATIELEAAEDGGF